MTEDVQKSVSRQSASVKKSVEHIERAASATVDSADRRTELAADRTILAAERTYAAWVRTGLGRPGQRRRRQGAVPEDLAGLVRRVDRLGADPVQRLLFLGGDLAGVQSCGAAQTRHAPSAETAAPGPERMAVFW